MKIKIKSLFPKNFRVSAVLYQPSDRSKKTDSYQVAGTLIDCYLQDKTGELVDDEGRLFIVWEIWVPGSSFGIKEPFIGDKLEINSQKFTIHSIQKQFNSQIEDHYKFGLKLAN